MELTKSNVFSPKQYKLCKAVVYSLPVFGVVLLYVDR